MEKRGLIRLLKVKNSQYKITNSFELIENFTKSINNIKNSFFQGLFKNVRMYNLSIYLTKKNSLYVFTCIYEPIFYKNVYENYHYEEVNFSS